MIYYFTPYSTTRTLGDAYNRYCKIVPTNDDWICLMDGDTCFLTPDYGIIINNAVEQYGGSYELLTCYTNRIWTKLQRLDSHPETLRSRDIIFHRDVAYALSKKNTEIISINEPISGFFLLFKKSTWLTCNFPLNSLQGGLLGIDYKWSQSLLDEGFRIGIISNLYVFHYYRLNGSGDKHLR